LLLRFDKVRFKNILFLIFLMIEAFILLRVKPGTEILVRDELSNFKEIVEINMLYGEWDFIVKVIASDLKQLRDFVIKNIRNIKGVLDTSTLISAE